MPSKIKPKRSYTANAVPTTSDLDANELAINWADGKAFTKNASGNIVSVTLGGGGGGGGSLSATVTIPAIGDQYWNSVGLLLRGDGQNNGTVFTDSGPFNKSITRTGSAVTSTAQSKFGGSSLYFDGNNSGLQIGSAFDETIAGFGTGDFTVETWFRTSTTARSTLFSAYRAIASATGLAIQINRDLGSGPAFGSVGFGYGDTTILDTAGGLWSANTWHHLAVVRSGSTVSIFIDGVSRASTTNTTNMSDGDRATVGYIRLTDSNLFGPYAGYLDDFRITKAARYTANFTPPTAMHATGAYTAPVTLPVVGTGSIGSGLTWSAVPASATATGTAGQIAYDDTNGFFYVATATNTWKRASLSTWYPNTPATISGLQLWLDAADPATLYDATSGGSLVAADGIVRRWQDKSGNDRHALESTYGPTRKTSQQNGYSALLFNGSSTFLAGSSTPSTGNVRTVFAITKSAITSGGELFQIGVKQSSSFRAFTVRQSYAPTNSLIASDLVVNNVNVNGEQLTIDQYHVSCWRQTASTRAVQYWHNGVQKTVTGTPDSLSVGAGYFVGKSRNNEDLGFWNGHIAEVIIYDVELSDADRAAVESYLKVKWAIA